MMLAICHTHYSLQTGIGSPRQWLEAAAKHGYAALAVADVNGLYGAVEFAQAAVAVGVRPIIGATLLLDWDSSCIVLAPNDIAYRQLCRLLTARHMHSSFDLEKAAAGKIDELVFLSRYGSVLHALARLVPAENLFALAPANSNLAQPLLWDHLPHGCRRAFIPDAWFLNERERIPFAYLRELRTRGKGDDCLLATHAGAVLPDANEWRRQFSDQTTTQELVERCHFRFPFGTLRLPRIALPRDVTAAEHLGFLCRLGIQQRYSKTQRLQAEERLQRELQIIIHNGYADYFLYVNEIIEFARKQHIPTGVRGSAASSIVSYVLGFTECCPIEYDLYFERFMNPGRRDCPDIDIDIADHRRDEIIRFCYDRWGERHVAMASTIQFYRTRGALRDAGRVLRLPTDKISALIEASDGDRQCPDLYRVAAHLVGRPRHLGVHCGGLFITPEPITDAVPLAMATKGVRITHFEKDQAEAVGLVKMDLLGNSALSMIDEAKHWLQTGGRELSEPGPALDFKVNRLFAQGDTLGVYQCESPGMRQLCKAIAPRTPREVAMTLSLIRPGPAAAGMKDAFVARRRGLESVDYIHPRMADFLGDTYGVMLYQEDVMKVAVNLAGYTLADADVLRRAVSKARSSQTFADEHHRFVFQKAQAAGIPHETADEIWDAVSRFAAYSYCKAHATVYARLAWLMARLKVHHPREFYAACLNRHKSMYPARVFVWDALRHGIPVHAPDILLSQANWTPVLHGVRAGLDLIRGISEATRKRLLQERTQQPFHDLADLIRRIRFRKGEAERLILVGACRTWGTRPDLLSELRELSQSGRQLSLLPINIRHLMPLLTAQLTLTGIPFCMHPAELVHKQEFCLAGDMGRHLDGTVTMTGILDAVKFLQTQPKEGDTAKEMSFVTLEDASGIFDAILFPECHARFGSIFQHIGPFQLSGRIIRQWDTLSLQLTDAFPLPLPA